MLCVGESPCRWMNGCEKMQRRVAAAECGGEGRLGVDFAKLVTRCSLGYGLWQSISISRTAVVLPVMRECRPYAGGSATRNIKVAVGSDSVKTEQRERWTLLYKRENHSAALFSSSRKTRFPDAGPERRVPAPMRAVFFRCLSTCVHTCCEMILHIIHFLATTSGFEKSACVEVPTSYSTYATHTVNFISLHCAMLGVHREPQRQCDHGKADISRGAPQKSPNRQFLHQAKISATSDSLKKTFSVTELFGLVP